MKFTLATLYVHDMEKSLHFYHDLLEIPVLHTIPAGPGQELVFLGVEGQPQLELIPVEQNPGYAGFSVGFEVDDLAAVTARLAANGYAVKRTMTTGGGSTLCFLDGPNGEEVELVANA